jgi:hypothetical protein
MRPGKNQQVMKPIAIIVCFASIAFILASGCTIPAENPNEVSGAGTVVYIDLEGGFYGIIASDGSEYLPLNLPEEYQENGISVVFEGVIREDMYTIQQWGTPLDITMIQEKS